MKRKAATHHQTGCSEEEEREYLIQKEEARKSCLALLSGIEEITATPGILQGAIQSSETQCPIPASIHLHFTISLSHLTIFLTVLVLIQLTFCVWLSVGMKKQ